MRSKSLLILVLVAVVSLVLSYSLFFKDEEIMDPSTGFPTGEYSNAITQLKNAYDAYDAVASVDYEAQKTLSEQLKSQLSFVSNEISVLNANLINIESEHAQKESELRQEKTAELNEKINETRNKIKEVENKIAALEEEKVPDNVEIFLESNGALIYSKVLDSISNTTNKEVIFVGENSEDGLYTVKLVGYVDSLILALNNLESTLAPYDISFGNCSLRQVYACYDNMRPWDKASLLDWFKNQYITGGGGLGNVQSGVIVDGIQVSGALGNDTVEILKQIKENAILATEEEYTKKMNDLKAEKLAMMIAAYQGEDQNKINALLAEINDYYGKAMSDAEAEKIKKINEITTGYDDRIAALENPPSDSSNVALANPELLIYTLDITFSVYDK